MHPNRQRPKLVPRLAPAPSAASGYAMLLAAVLGAVLCVHIFTKPATASALKLRSHGITARAKVMDDSYKQSGRAGTSYAIGYRFLVDGVDYFGRQTLSTLPDIDNLDIRYLDGDPTVNAIDVEDYIAWHLFNLYWLVPLSAVLLLVGAAKVIGAARGAARRRAQEPSAYASTT